MQHLFSPDGEAALTILMRRQPLLAFDFDGTLAPIVEHPDHARILPDLAGRLRALAARLPVAIVTGRARADVQPRLGFEPRYVVGNHGAEHEGGGEHVDPETALAAAAALRGLRQRLHEHALELAGAGVMVEDKGASLALHYRTAPEPGLALALILALLAPAHDALHVFAGKMVVNAVAAGAPDKADAMRRLVAHSGVTAAFFAGDDLNDEPVFAAAPPDWLTVRVGPAEWLTQARYCLNSPEEMVRLLDRMLALHDTAPPR